MCDLNLNFLGIQEARSPAGTSRADDAIRLASGCVKGQHGVELWINTKQPIAYRHNKPCFVQMTHVQVVHADHRRLLVRLAHPCIDCHLCVLHAPQSGRPLSERRAWWEETQRIMTQFVCELSLYVFMDANAKTGPCCEPIVFANDDSCSENTVFMMEFLKTFGLCLPSTTALHRGSHGTWTAPDGWTQHRIDYIAIPQNELCFCMQSCSIDNFDTGNSHEDHQAVGVQLQWIQDRQTCLSKAKIGKHDRNAIKDQEHVIDLAAVQTCAWHEDIETQVQSLNQAIHCTLQAACPRQKQGKKKQYLSAEIWDYRIAKLHLRRRLQNARRQASLDSIRLVFWAWKNQEADPDGVDVIVNSHVAHANTVLCSIFQLNCRYYRIARMLRRELQQAKTRQLSHALDQTSEVTPAGTLLQTLKPFIGPTNLKKQQKTGLPAVRKQNGEICTTPEEAQNRWIEFFSHLEGGTRMDHDTYRTIWRQNLAKFLVTDSFSIAIKELPSLAELEMAYRRVPFGKAVGNDGIPPEVCHVKARDLARLTYAILIKVFVYGQEAIEHKGGRLAVAWKHRGDVRDCDTHRSLLVSSHMGKTIHRALRQKHHSLYTAYMQTQQLGGRPKIPVGILPHLSRAFMRWQARLQRPTACIFLDLAEAFYRLIRPLALGGDLSDDDIAVIAARIGLGHNALHQFHAQLKEPSALQQAGAAPVVQKFLQALHSDTWFQIGTQDDVVRTAIGSRPGDSYADVVFGLLWAQLLRRYEDQLVAHDVLEVIPVHDLPSFGDQVDGPQVKVPFLGPTWMDDLNVCIAADSNLGLERKAGLAMSLLLDQCREMHMEPNLRKGKTEIMFTFRGSRSREFRRKYFSSAQGLTVVGEHDTVQVSVVSRYLHLGGILHHRDIDRVEVSRRLAIAHQAFTAHRRILYHNCKIQWKKRREIFVTLILSKLVYGLESWTLKSQKVKVQFHSGVMSLYRRLLKLPHDMHITDLHLLTRAGLPSPGELLRSSRLRYFGTLHRCGRAANWGVIAEDHDWIALIQDDMQWLWSQVSNTTDLKDPVDHYPVWKDLLTFHSSYWKKLVRRGIAHAIAQRNNYVIALDFHCSIGSILHVHDWVAELPADDTRTVPSEAYGCMCCQQRFLTHAGESVHMFKKHGRVAPARSLFDETHCPACLREYHTRAKVLAHLRHADRCRRALIGQRMQCAIVPGTGSSIDRELENSMDGALPFQQAFGPQRPNVRQADFDQHNIRLLEDLYLALLEVTSTDDLEQVIRTEIGRHPVGWTVCRLTLLHFLAIFTEQDAEVLAFSFDAVRRCIEILARDGAWPFLQMQCVREGSSVTQDISVWEAWFAEFACEPPASWKLLQPLPRSLSKQKIILHAYAGRRRRGDIEWYVDAMAARYPSHVIHVASVDIVIDATFGDISREQTRSYWIGHILQGHVIGFLAGPPCNTWSRARHHVIAGVRGPRVVRTPQEPWGKESLSLTELQHVSIGNLLLGFALACLTALAMRSGTGLVEHPKDPEKDEMVSIWRLPVLRAILQLPNVRLVHLAQGLFGAPSAKPTTLMVLGMSTLEKFLHENRVTREIPNGASVGKDQYGQFKTSPLKEYPPALCKAIAEALCMDIVSTKCDDTEVPADLVERCKAMTCQFFGTYIGPDS